MDPETPDVFHLSRPASHSVRSTKEPITTAPIAGKKRSKSGGSQGNGQSRQRHYYSVSNFVSRWLGFRKEKRLAEAHIQIGNTTLTYKQLFKGVYNQNAEVLEDAPHIYWGKAWAKLLSNDRGFRLEFNNTMNANGKPRRPSLLIYDNKIEQYAYKKRLLTHLETAIEKENGGCILFVFNVPIIEPDLKSATEAEPYTRAFINFHVDDLDMLDIHPLDLFKHLKGHGA